jgi:nucleoid-associated protein YgaU
MPKDLKIGLAVGMGLVAVAVLWLATRPSLTPQARIQHLHNAEAQKKTGAQPEVQDSMSDTRYAMPDERASRIQKPESSISPKGRLAPENPESRIQNEQIELIKTERFYIVRKNDTLSSISQKYYGTAMKWPKIFDANRETISDANKLPIGTKLIIPD